MKAKSNWNELSIEERDSLNANWRTDNLGSKCNHDFVYKILHDHAAADICTKCGYIKKQ